MLHVNQLVGFGAGQDDRITFVGGNTDARTASAAFTMSLTSGLTGGISSSASSGDLVIAVGSITSRTGTSMGQITDGTNPYTDFASTVLADDGSQTSQLRVAYKFITNDTTVTFPGCGAGHCAVSAVYVFRNVNTSTPSDVTPTTATSVSSAIADPPSITPTTAGAYIVCAGASTHTEAVDTFNSSDLTDFMSAGADGSERDGTLGVGHKPDWTSGAFNAAAFTFSGGDNAAYAWTAISIALRPK